MDRRDYETLLPNRNLKLTGFGMVFSNIDTYIYDTFVML